MMRPNLCDMWAVPWLHGRSRYLRSQEMQHPADVFNGDIKLNVTKTRSPKIKKVDEPTPFSLHHHHQAHAVEAVAPDMFQALFSFFDSQTIIRHTDTSDSSNLRRC